MSKTFQDSEQSADIAHAITAAEAASAELLYSLIKNTCRRLSLPSQRANCERIHELVEEGAFIQAAISLTELELPQWKIRRLVYDEGAWHCALSRQRELPDWLDQAVEACHADMPLAIAAAYLEAVRQRDAEPLPQRHFVPQISKRDFYAVCCENLA